MPRLRFARNLLAALAWVFLSLGAHAEESALAPAADLFVVKPAEETIHAPEPTTTMLAGLAGVLLLIFALRRK